MERKKKDQDEMSRKAVVEITQNKVLRDEDPMECAFLSAIAFLIFRLANISWNIRIRRELDIKHIGRSQKSSHIASFPTK